MADHSHSIADTKDLVAAKLFGVKGYVALVTGGGERVCRQKMANKD